MIWQVLAALALLIVGGLALLWFLLTFLAGANSPTGGEKLISWPALIVAALAFAAVIFIVGRADAHDAPSGWSYPFSCCSGYDCRPVKPAAIGTTADGYLVKPSGEVVVFGDSRIKVSPDGEFHWCSNGGRDDGRTICLFVPPQLF